MLLSLSAYWKSLFKTSAGLISGNRYELVPMKQWPDAHNQSEMSSTSETLFFWGDPIQEKHDLT